jgi:DNA polymerase III sliding clamp (beta) subunit (PCNA family)
MKLTINTAKLQSMVAKSVKGASNNKQIPLTGMMAIELKDNKLSLITTDATNYLYIMEDKVVGDDFYVVVQVDLFSKLIAKMTCENITLELDTDVLKVKGNGNYSIELPLDEEGRLIKYPDPFNAISVNLPASEINLSTIRLILGTAKAALAPAVEEDNVYSHYYVGDKIVATDTYKICGIDIKLLESPALLSSQMMDLLDLMTDEKIEVMVDGDTYIFRTSGCIVYGKSSDMIGDFAIEAITGLLEDEYESSCKVPKDALLQLLDRLALFVGIYDRNGIYLTFTKDGLMINSKQSSGSELIAYNDSKNFTDYTCCIDIEMLRTQVKANAADIIEIQYGKENAIKMVDGNTTQIVALLEDDRLSE